MKRQHKTMPGTTRAWLDEELRSGRRSEDPWPHLERAHIVSQPWAWQHTRVHWAMLATATRQRDPKEFAGQVVRLVVAGPGSLVGKYPVGNTGRTTMRLTEVAPIPDDLESLLPRQQ